MFTGIIECQGIIKKITKTGSNKTFWIKSAVSSRLKVNQSISHDGVCLTVEEVKKNRHKVTAIEETLKKTTLGNWQVDSIINIERCLRLDDRLDGHFVQGHVDATGICIEKYEKEGSLEFRIQFPGHFTSSIIEKGSIAMNGVSLTAFNVSHNSFDVAVIPYTLDNTNLKHLKPGITVNLEFDVIGKYIQRKLSLINQ